MLRHTMSNSCSVNTFHHHISLLLSIAEHRNLKLISSVTGPMPPAYKNSPQSCRGRRSIWQVAVSCCAFPYMVHSSIFSPHRPSVLRAMWPAHCHFSLLIRFTKKITYTNSQSWNHHLYATQIFDPCGDQTAHAAQELIGQLPPILPSI